MCFVVLNAIYLSRIRLDIVISRLAFCVDASAADLATAGSGQTLIWIFPMNGVFIGKIISLRR